MRLTTYFLALALAVPAAQATAGSVFYDGFDADAAGSTALNFSSFANFAVVGNVDLIKNGDYGITCHGSCVDLDGSSGPGRITSLSSFTFASGDKVRLTFDIGGNQRTGDVDGYYMAFEFTSPVDVIDFGSNPFGTDLITIPGLLTNAGLISEGSDIGGADPFKAVSLFFTAATPGSLRFHIGTYSADNIGPLLDNVNLSVESGVPEPANWAMMLAGFWVVGGALRLGRKTQAICA